MFTPMMKRAAALLALAALASCGGGGGGGGPVEARVAGVAAAEVLESNSGTTTLRFAVTLDRPVVSSLRIVYSTASTGKGGNATTGSAAGGASCTGGADYVSVAGREVPLGAGASSAELQVTVCGDTDFEASETVAVNWSVIDGSSGSAIGTIVNDDAGGINGTAVAGTFGRDSSALTSDDADGRLGFSFAKVPSAADFRCARDNVTGLLWETKAAGGGGVHDATRTYAYADLAAFVAAVNAENLCGRSDWRLPTPRELSGLVDAGTASAPTIDATFFPNTRAAAYWTGSSYRDGVANDAWFVDFGSGAVAIDNKTKTFAARLVTSGTLATPAPTPAACADTTRFTDHGDGTVTDKGSNLMWKRCAEGLAGASCSGSGASFEWDAARARPATVNADAASSGLGYADWRLPTRAELASIAEHEQCFNPAANTATFPGAEPLGFWSATPAAMNSSLAWAVDFFDGQVAPAFKTGAGSSSKRVRLVRAGQ